MFETLKINEMFADDSIIENFEECTIYHIQLIEDMLKKREPEIFNDGWQALFEKQLKYKKPFLVNSDVVREFQNYREIYVAPVFARSGRQVFVIQPGESHETMEVYQSIIDFR